ncbi:hypothetical protein [uncultured Dysosmobacter sp.]|uniref:hypothetical protein n=1 Tax=uncultured Dysosmobacter sp. TaxID=2591384 RepID=UPI0026147C35|nr:hypothetical protein [uncultured Dysosmobacter sp.]
MYDNEPPVDSPMQRTIEGMCVYIAPPQNGKEKKSADNLKLMLKMRIAKFQKRQMAAITIFIIHQRKALTK